MIKGTLFVSLCLISQVYGDSVNQSQKEELVQKAADARHQAYAPYSKFKVGAAVLDDKGVITPGANMENASYGLTLCAERVAIFSALANGSKYIKAIAVIVPGGGTPCGACRQVLNEFNPELIVLYGNEEGRLVKESNLKELLPDAFGPHNLL